MASYVYLEAALTMDTGVGSDVIIAVRADEMRAPTAAIKSKKRRKAVASLRMWVRLKCTHCLNCVTSLNACTEHTRPNELQVYVHIHTITSNQVCMDVYIYIYVSVHIVDHHVYIYIYILDLRLPWCLTWVPTQRRSVRLQPQLSPSPRSAGRLSHLYVLQVHWHNHGIAPTHVYVFI